MTGFVGGLKRSCSVALDRGICFASGMRETTIVRANCLLPGNTIFNDLLPKLESGVEWW